MKRLFYGVAVSALMLGAGGVAMAECGAQHTASAALKNLAAATQAAPATERGVVLAQTQQEEQSGTTGEGVQQQEEQGATSGEEMQQKEEHGGTTGQGMQQEEQQGGTTGEGSHENSEESK